MYFSDRTGMMTSFNNRMSQYFPVTETAPIICIDSVELVQEVKKHPEIYDSSMRRDQMSVFAAWEVVNVALLPHFPIMNDDQKAMIRKKLRHRWSWMRSTLRRDLSRNKFQCHMHLKWMQELQFLVPIMLKKCKDNPVKKNTLPRFSNSACDSSAMSTYNVVTSSTATIPHFSARSRAASPTYNASRLLFQNAPHFDGDNEATIQTFLTSFGSDGNTPSTDADKDFLFVLLRVFRNIGTEQKSFLRDRFYFFLSQ